MMRPLVAVVLVVGSALWVRQIGAHAGGGDPHTIGIALGVTLILAFVTGELLRRGSASISLRLSSPAPR